jgi:Ca2+/Na+ antiporter
LDVVPFLDAEQLARAQAARTIMMLNSLFILLIVFMDVNRKKTENRKISVNLFAVFLLSVITV